MGEVGGDPRESAEKRLDSLDGDSEMPPEEKPVRSEEELAKIALAAKEAKTTIIAVAALTIGSIVFMFLITLVAVALKYF